MVLPPKGGRTVLGRKNYFFVAVIVVLVMEE